MIFSWCLLASCTIMILPRIMNAANCISGTMGCCVLVENSESEFVPGCHKAKCGEQIVGYVIDYVGLNQCHPLKNLIFSGQRSLSDHPACFCRFQAVIKKLTMDSCELVESCSGTGSSIIPCRSCDNQDNLCVDSAGTCEGQLSDVTQSDLDFDLENKELPEIGKHIFAVSGKHIEGFYDVDLLQDCNNCSCTCEKTLPPTNCKCGCECTLASLQNCHRFVESKFPMTVTTHSYVKQCCMRFENGYNVAHQDCSTYAKVTKNVAVMLHKPEPCDSSQWEASTCPILPSSPSLNDCFLDDLVYLWTAIGALPRTMEPASEKNATKLVNTASQAELVKTASQAKLRKTASQAKLVNNTISQRVSQYQQVSAVDTVSEKCTIDATRIVTTGFTDRKEALKDQESFLKEGTCTTAQIAQCDVPPKLIQTSCYDLVLFWDDADCQQIWWLPTHVCNECQLWANDICDGNYEPGMCEDMNDYCKHIDPKFLTKAQLTSVQCLFRLGDEPFLLKKSE